LPKQVVCLVGWFLGIGLGISVVYGIYTVTKEGGRPFNQAENIIYGTFSRFTWGLALAWVVYACHRGYGSKRITVFISVNYFWGPLYLLWQLAKKSRVFLKTNQRLSFKGPLH